MAVLLCSAQLWPHSVVVRSQWTVNQSRSPPAAKRNKILPATVVSAGLLLSVLPAEAGILSGSTGFNFSIPPLEFPLPENLKKMTEARRQKYADLEANFKASPLVEKLKKRSEENMEMRKIQTQDKYCERQLDWGIGDCGLVGATPEERQAFKELLQKKRSPPQQ